MIEETKKKIAENLISSFEEAGNISLKLRKQGLKKEIKIDNTPVTNGDIEVNKLITAKIEKITPEIPIVSEESSTNKSNENLKTFWLIDPIDGTHDYINGRDEFTINASLIINLEPTIGLIYAPAKKRLFYSYANGHSFEKFEQKKTRLICKKKTKHGEVHAVTHSSIPPSEVLKIHKKFNVKNFIKMKSSYKFCVIAAGEFDLYAAKARAYEWDIAAGHAILKHAGGIVTTLNEEEFKYGKTDYKNLDLLARRSENLER